MIFLGLTTNHVNAKSDIYYNYFKDISSFEDTTDKQKVKLKKQMYDDSLSALENDIQINFALKFSEHSYDSSYFNVVTIKNTSNKTQSGTLKFRVPKEWTLIATNNIELSLSPGEEIRFPVRMSISSNAIGGIAYILDCSFENRNGVFSGVSYIRIPLKQEWDFEVEKPVVYFNEYYDITEFKLQLNNKGNGTELIKLSVEVGKLFDIVELDQEILYVELPPKTDSTLTFSIRKNPELTFEDKEYYKSIWNESTIKFKATGSGEKSSVKVVEFRDLENFHENQRYERMTPLNLQMSFFNLLAPTPVNINFGLAGQLLFNKNHDFQYNILGRNIYNIETGQFAPINLNNPYNFSYNFKYSWNSKIFVTAGITDGFTNHNIRGNGIKAEYRLSNKSNIGASYVTHQLLPITIASAMYRTTISKVNLSAGLAFENNDFVHFDAASVDLRANFSPFKNQYFGVSLLTSGGIIDLNQGIGPNLDSNAIGISYGLQYNGNFWNKLFINVTTRNDRFNFIKLRPLNFITGTLRYQINPKNSIRGLANVYEFYPSTNSYSPFAIGFYSRTHVYRLTWNRIVTKKISFEVGPSAKILGRTSYNGSQSEITEDFNNYFLGIFANTRIKLDKFKTLTPNIYIGRTSYRNELINQEYIAPQLTTAVSLSYSDRFSGLNASYSRGPNFFITEDFLDIDPVSFETVSLRAHINKLVYEGRIKLTGYTTYFLRMPSNRQNVNFSGRVDLYHGKGWESFIVGNLFLTSAFDESESTVTNNRFFSLNAGVSKSFDFDQPRIKYSDIKVICFNDFNGDGVRDENEPLLSNIKLTISRDDEIEDPRKLLWNQLELITSVEGEVNVKNMPDINYIFNFEELINLGNLFNVNGNEQRFKIDEDKTIYVPYAEAYKVSGTVTLIRDDFSSKGRISAGGIRVTASNRYGEYYSALTDNDGNYTIDIPQAGSYTVTVNNIFGDEFYIDKEDYLVQFNGVKLFNVDFTFFEGQREMNVIGENFFDFGNGASSNDSNSELDNDSTKIGAQVNPSDILFGSDSAVVDSNVDQNDSSSNRNGSDEGTNDNTGNVVNPESMQNADVLRTTIQEVSEENEKNISTPVDPNKVTYMVEIGMFDEEVETPIANLILNLGFQATSIKVNGVTVYATPAEKTFTEIQEVFASIKEAGLTEAIVVGMYEGKIITEAKAREYRGE